jgi:ABC-type multidrug transport system fused ATPase/permease subunit
VGEPLRLTELAQNVGLGQSLSSQLADIAARQRDLTDDIEEVKEVSHDTLEGIQRVEEHTQQYTQEQPRSVPPLLGIGTRRVVQIAAQPRPLFRGYGARQAAPIRQPQRATGDANVGGSILATAQIGAAFWPVLRVLGLIAGAGFLVVKTFQWVAGAAEKAGARLMSIFDQFADVSPAVAGMRSILEVYGRRDRMAVAAALTPQWRRELVTYRELLDNTRDLRIIGHQLASQFRVAMMKLVTFVADILNAVSGIYTYLFGEATKETTPAQQPLHPIVEALKQVLRNQNPPAHWRPAPPPKRRPGVL